MKIFHENSHSYLFVVKSSGKNIITFYPEEGDVIIGRLNVEYITTHINEEENIEIREGYVIITNDKYQFHSGNEEMLDEQTTMCYFFNRDSEEYHTVEVIERLNKKSVIYLIKEQDYYKLCTITVFDDYIYPKQETKEKNTENEEYYIDLDI